MNDLNGYKGIRMRKRILCAAVCTAVLGAGLQVSLVPVSGAAENASAQAQSTEDVEKDGLVEEDGAYRYYEDGQPVTDRWITAEGNTYYFDENGEASVLKCRIDGAYYVFDQEGRLIQPSGKRVVKVTTGDGEVKRYYADPEGKALSGWSQDKTYYFDKTGEMVTGAIVLKEKFYFFNASGRYNKDKTQKIRKAAKYEKPFADLLKYIGKPKKAKYYTSCYGKGKDGILTYDGYKVYTFKPDSGAEIFMGAE